MVKPQSSCASRPAHPKSTPSEDSRLYRSPIYVPPGPRTVETLTPKQFVSYFCPKSSISTFGDKVYARLPPINMAYTIRESFRALAERKHIPVSLIIHHCPSDPLEPFGREDLDEYIDTHEMKKKRVQARKQQEAISKKLQILKTDIGVLESLKKQARRTLTKVQKQDLRKLPDMIKQRDTLNKEYMKLDRLLSRPVLHTYREFFNHFMKSPLVPDIVKIDATDNMVPPQILVELMLNTTGLKYSEARRNHVTCLDPALTNRVRNLWNSGLSFSQIVRFLCEWPGNKYGLLDAHTPDGLLLPPLWKKMKRLDRKIWLSERVPWLDLKDQILEEMAERTRDPARREKFIRQRLQYHKSKEKGRTRGSKRIDTTDYGAEDYVFQRGGSMFDVHDVPTDGDEINIVKTYIPAGWLFSESLIDGKLNVPTATVIRFVKYVDCRIAYRPEASRQGGDTARCVEVVCADRVYHVPVVIFQSVQSVLAPGCSIGDSLAAVSRSLSAKRELPIPIEAIPNNVLSLICVAALWSPVVTASAATRISCWMRNFPRAERYYLTPVRSEKKTPPVKAELMPGVTLHVRERASNYWRAGCLFKDPPKVAGVTVGPLHTPLRDIVGHKQGLSKRQLQDVGDELPPQSLIDEGTDWLIAAVKASYGLQDGIRQPIAVSSNAAIQKLIDFKEVPLVREEDCYEVCEKHAAQKFGRKSQMYDAFMDGVRSALSGQYSERRVKRGWGVFPKNEFYDDADGVIRYIIAPDMWSRGYDMAALWYAVEIFFGCGIHFVKHMTPAEVFEMLNKDFPCYQQDVSGYELRNKKPFLNAARRVLAAMNPNMEAAINSVYDSLTQPHNLHGDDFTARGLPPCTLSGSFVTSVGNAISNIIVHYIVMKNFGHTLDWFHDWFIVEGDDLLFDKAYFPASATLDSYQAYSTKIGFKLTLEYHSSPMSGSFLGYHGEEYEGKWHAEPVNPYVTLSKIAWHVGIPLDSNRRDGELLYAKCLSALVRYPNCSITDTLLKWARSARRRFDRFTSTTEEYVTHQWEGRTLVGMEDITGSLGAFVHKFGIKPVRNKPNVHVPPEVAKIEYEYFPGLPALYENNCFSTALLHYAQVIAEPEAEVSYVPTPLEFRSTPVVDVAIPKPEPAQVVVDVQDPSSPQPPVVTVEGESIVVEKPDTPAVPDASEDTHKPTGAEVIDGSNVKSEMSVESDSSDNFTDTTRQLDNPCPKTLLDVMKPEDYPAYAMSKYGLRQPDKCQYFPKERMGDVRFVSETYLKGPEVIGCLDGLTDGVKMHVDPTIKVLDEDDKPVTVPLDDFAPNTVMDRTYFAQEIDPIVSDARHASKGLPFTAYHTNVRVTAERIAEVGGRGLCFLRAYVYSLYLQGFLPTTCTPEQMVEKMAREVSASENDHQNIFEVPPLVSHLMLIPYAYDHEEPKKPFINLVYWPDAPIKGCVVVAAHGTDTFGHFRAVVGPKIVPPPKKKKEDDAPLPHGSQQAIKKLRIERPKSKGGQTAFEKLFAQSSKPPDPALQRPQLPSYINVSLDRWIQVRTILKWSVILMRVALVIFLVIQTGGWCLSYFGINRLVPIHKYMGIPYYVAAPIAFAITCALRFLPFLRSVHRFVRLTVIDDFLIFLSAFMLLHRIVWILATFVLVRLLLFALRHVRRL